MLIKDEAAENGNTCQLSKPDWEMKFGLYTTIPLRW